MFDDILGDDATAEERKIKRHLQDVIDIFDFSEIHMDNVVKLFENLHNWMKNVYGIDWEDDYEIILDYDKQKKRYIVDVRRK
jgi:plasmid maintenance system killer protein